MSPSGVSGHTTILSAWTHCLSSLLGRPSAFRFPSHHSLVVLLLRLRPTSLRDIRDRLMVALATICCLRVSELVALQAFSAARCPHCPPLFSRLDNGPAGSHKASMRPLSTQMVGDSLRRMMALCGANVRHFSGISARKGGLSTAITAGVTEEILFLQSGHGQARAARNYIHLQDPARLFDTFRAFGL